MSDECMEILILMSGGAISQEKLSNIKELYKLYSRGLEKYGKTLWDFFPKTMKTAAGGVSQMELGNMLDTFKTNNLSSLAS